jgi:hypothetical protein
MITSCSPTRICISFLRLFRHNIFEDAPNDQQFQLKLELIFPLMFPQHDIVGLDRLPFVD